jgi:hypothetical protein
VRKVGANVWLLAGLVLVAAAIGLDFALRQGRPPAPEPVSAGPDPAAEAAVTPEFGVGDRAPDFTLPDVAGRRHRLADLVRGETYLWLTCGCAHCINLQTYFGILLDVHPGPDPLVINVTTMPLDREESYRRDVALRQVFLYEPKDGSVMHEYRGHPCPRIYRLDAERRVRWISPSPKTFPYIDALGNLLAEQLGFQEPGGKDPNRPEAPRWTGPPRAGG